VCLESNLKWESILNDTKVESQVGSSKKSGFTSTGTKRLYYINIVRESVAKNVVFSIMRSM
jgi:hypothetical protein